MKVGNAVARGRSDRLTIFAWSLAKMAVAVASAPGWFFTTMLIWAAAQSALSPQARSIQSASPAPASARSEARRVGNECVSTCRSRGSPYHQKKNKKHNTIRTHNAQHYIMVYSILVANTL